MKDCSDYPLHYKQMLLRWSYISCCWTVKMSCLLFMSQTNNIFMSQTNNKNIYSRLHLQTVKQFIAKELHLVTQYSSTLLTRPNPTSLLTNTSTTSNQPLETTGATHYIAQLLMNKFITKGYDKTKKVYNNGL